MKWSLLYKNNMQQVTRNKQIVPNEAYFFYSNSPYYYLN